MTVSFPEGTTGDDLVGFLKAALDAKLYYEVRVALTKTPTS